MARNGATILMVCTVMLVALDKEIEERVNVCVTRHKF